MTDAGDPYFVPANGPFADSFGNVRFFPLTPVACKDASIMPNLSSLQDRNPLLPLRLTRIPRRSELNMKGNFQTGSKKKFPAKRNL